MQTLNKAEYDPEKKRDIRTHADRYEIEANGL